MSARPRDLALLESLWREPVERYTLLNGLTVLLRHDTAAPVSSVQVWVKTGSTHEGAHLGAGLSHYLEHMLFKGTERRAGREISATVQAHGGYINAYTTFDRTVYYIDVPSIHTAVAIDLLADATLHSLLPAEEVTKEKDVILREIDMCLDDPDQRLSQALFETAFRTHPYRQPIIGHRDVFAANTREDLLAYYRARYVPNNLVVVIAGAFDPVATRAAIAEHFGKAPRVRLAPVLVPDEPVQLSRRDQHLSEDVQVSRAGLGWQIPGLTHPDAPALDMLAMVLGHGDSSLLWQAIREKARLVHSIDAMAWSPGTSGLFYISFLADPDKRVAAESAILAELARIGQKGISPKALAKAVRQAVTSEINMRKTMSGQASRLGAGEVVVGDINYARTYFERLFALTPAGLKKVMHTYLVPEKLTVVSSNPAGAAAAPVLRGLGEGGSSLDFEELTLPNGARLLLQPNKHLPNLHLRLALAGGPMFEPADRRGLTNLLSTLLAKDTTKRSAEEVARAIEAVGGAFEDFSGNNSYGLMAEVLPGDADLALELISDAVLRPAFKPARLEVERESALAALKEGLDDVVTVGRKAMRAKFFGAHPFAIESGGDEAGLKAITVADLRALHRRQLVSGNAVLAVAGDFDAKKLVPKLKAFLAQLPKGAAAKATAALKVKAGDFTETQPRQQAIVFQAFPGPGLHAPDYTVSEVMDELFSGMSSHLFERVREEKSLAYFVRSSRIVGLETGMFYFYAGTSPQRYGEVVEELNLEITRVQGGGVTPEELARCQTRLKAGKRMGLQTNSSRAMQSALNAVYGLPVNDWRTYDTRIDAVTLADVQAFARRYFKSGSRVQLVVKP
ncbi:pitrilysin family protein [Opitutus sp. GAS368]|uniref:M16 family metallopeptidase n=1 Tax=Opitutus sp. GAS368 TaxID=1882749 RepID=UPI000B85EE29|nr:pitrilysin family protein [Opitutus sp. GAS368]